MLPLRTYLITRDRNRDWDVTVHRDLDSIVSAWTSMYPRDENVTGFIHVGFTRSDTTEFNDLANSYPGKMLLTAPAKYIFHRVGKCAPGIAGTIDGIPVYVVVSGWGYETTEQEVDLTKDQCVRSECDHCHYKQGAESATPWLSSFAKSFPTEAESLNAAEITDDDSYLNFESGLPEDLRMLIGRFRFQYLSVGIDMSCPSEIASIAPPWARDMPIGQAGFRVRAYNVFIREGINFIKDLSGYTNSQIRKWEHIGRKSIPEIAQAIIDVIGVLPTGTIPRAENNEGESSSCLKTVSNYRQKIVESDAFGESLLELLRSMDKRSAMVIRRRMGLGTRPKTLEEIADLLGVTRERVRQIEKKVCMKEASWQFWQDIIEAPIKEAMIKRSTPLPVVGLEIVNPWFKDIANLEGPLKFCLEKFCSGDLHVIQSGGISFISSIAQEEWESLVKMAVDVLENGAALKEWTESEAKHAVGAILPDACKEFTEELYHAISKNVLFSVLDGSDEPVLTSIKKWGAEVYVESILSESDRPLHYTEIAERISAKGRAIDTRRAHSAAATTALLYGRGIYGLMQHFPLDDDETTEIVAEVEDIIGTGLNGRQWHCIELLKILGERGLDMDGRLDQYVVNIALKRSNFLSSLGRLMWTSVMSTGVTSADRIEIRQAIESLLQIEGKPLAASEIRERLLMEGRGLSGFMQINNEGNIIRLGPSFWGLLDRDVPLSQEQQKLIIETVENKLFATQKGMHKSEVYEALKNIPGVESLASSDPILFISIVLRSDKIRYAIGNFLYLSEWGAARRVTVEEAVKIIFEQVGSTELTAHDLREKISSIVGYQISPYAIYAPLSALGVRYNSDRGYWRLTDGEDPTISGETFEQGCLSFVD